MTPIQDAADRPRILIVAPFTHQNGHFVIFPRDISCALKAVGCQVTLLHTRPFRTELDWLGSDIERICLRDLLESSPRWWKEAWAKLANSPSAQCLAWIIWKMRPSDFDLVLWTDFQAQSNVWPLRIAQLLHLYHFKTAFFEHHPPDKGGGLQKFLPRVIRPDRLRLSGLKMFVFSKALLKQWNNQIGDSKIVDYVPWGVWPKPLSESQRSEARISLGIADEARVLLIFGVQATNRKHLDTLAKAATGLTTDKPLLLLFVGATLGKEPHPFTSWQSSGIEARIEDGFVPEDRVELYFAATDAVWANYRDFPGASGALLQAMGSGRVAISSNDGEIGALCKENRLGPMVESASTAHLRVAIHEFVTMSKEQQLEWEQHVAATAQQYAWPKIVRKLMLHLGISTSPCINDNLSPGSH